MLIALPIHARGPQAPLAAEEQREEARRVHRLARVAVTNPK